MASTQAKGVMREHAMRRIENALSMTLPTQGRDPELIHIQQLEAIADVLEQAQAGDDKPARKRSK